MRKILLISVFGANLLASCAPGTVGYVACYPGSYHCTKVIPLRNQQPTRECVEALFVEVENAAARLFPRADKPLPGLIETLTFYPGDFYTDDGLRVWGLATMDVLLRKRVKAVMNFDVLHTLVHEYFHIVGYAKWTDNTGHTEPEWEAIRNYEYPKVPECEGQNDYR